MTDVDLAASFAIIAAKRRGSAEVFPDELLIGCLQTLSQFGVVQLGPWTIDLEALGADWMQGPEKTTGVAYSESAVEIFDRAVRIARSGGSARVGVNHLLAAFGSEENGLMGELKSAHGITSASWRAAIAGITTSETAEAAKNGDAPPAAGREYLTTEDAAAALGIHVQTMRAYVRSGRVPAFRLAGERSIRIRREDLEKVLEPLIPEGDPAAKKTTKGE